MFLSFAIRWSGDVDIGIGCGTDRVGCKNAIAGACQVGSDLSRIFGSINLPHLKDGAAGCIERCQEQASVSKGICRSQCQEVWASRSAVVAQRCHSLFALFMLREVCHEAAANFSKAGDEPLHVEGKETSKNIDFKPTKASGLTCMQHPYQA